MEVLNSEAAKPTWGKKQNTLIALADNQETVGEEPNIHLRITEQASGVTVPRGGPHP